MHPNDTTLNDYVDGTLRPGRAGRGRAAPRRRARRAAQTVDDLREILRAAATLELLEPPVRVVVAPRTRDQAGAANAGSRQHDRRGSAGGAPSRRHGHCAFAHGVGLPCSRPPRRCDLAPFVGSRVRRRAAERPPARRRRRGGEAAQSIETELRQAEEHYENAIKGLEQIANSEQSELDPRTAATLQKNLAVIDQAISESRAAVRAQPASEPAQQSLIDGFKTKIGLLQDTVALINEMRKGNEAGAARIVSGLKQKGT